MDIFFYIIIFIMGTFFGSFFTLAVYRIPLKKDITHERSFCPNCNHKLGFLDLFPVWSYIFLRGKCRYCGEKIRIRYLILEVLSGLVFVLAYKSLNIQNIILDFNKIPLFVEFVFLYVTLCLVAGIDKEYRKINSSVVLFGGIVEWIYILYLYIIEHTSIYRYSIYGAIFILMYIINYIVQKKKENYIMQVLLLITYTCFVLGWKVLILSVVVSIAVGAVLTMIQKKNFLEIKIGFVFGLCTIVCEIVENFIIFYNLI